MARRGGGIGAGFSLETSLPLRSTRPSAHVPDQAITDPEYSLFTGQFQRSLKVQYVAGWVRFRRQFLTYTDALTTRRARASATGAGEDNLQSGSHFVQNPLPRDLENEICHGSRCRGLGYLITDRKAYFATIE